ncbi:MAG TPA: TIGR00730 family Rossman fold protein [Acetobacteraceae bacterium]|nr:TIGR00730 family Rossman fold protein [Acetobacteraceae bacterium]
MPRIASVAVFCGSRAGLGTTYRSAAKELGAELARACIRLVYGGGRIGLMGAMADAAIAGGGEVLGVIPDFLQRAEIAHAGVTELVVTGSMHERKQLMFNAADAFVTFAGGLGTLDETFEILTWRQLGLHDKPILICDIAGSAGPLLGLLDSVVESGFAQPAVRDLYEVVTSVPSLMDRLTRLEKASGGEAALL